MKSFLTVINEDKKSVINRLKGLSTDEKKFLIDLFKKKPHLEDLKDKSGKRIIDWGNKKLVFSDFNDVINHTSKSEKKKAVKDKGISGLKVGVDYLPIKVKDDDWNGYIPLTWEASKHIASKRIGGVEGEWCTAYQKTDQYWIEYMIEEELIPIYMVGQNYDAFGDKGWYNTKFAIVITPFSNWEMFDAEDHPAESISGHIDVAKDIIVPNKTVLKKAQKLIMKYGIVAGDFVVKARTEAANYKMEDGMVVWTGGIWRSGEWKNGTWYGGEFQKGEWKNGTWYGGAWSGGVWNDGWWKNGRWYNGTWVHGIWETGIWTGGLWNGGEWISGEWYDGIWYTGEWKNGKWYNGSWKGGEWYKGEWHNGTWRDGTWTDGKWKDGVWRDGVWIDGEWTGGIWEGGQWRDGTWTDGIWEGGHWWKGTWHGGKWEGGVWHGGYDKNGDFHGADDSPDKWDIK